MNCRQLTQRQKYGDVLVHPWEVAYNYRLCHVIEDDLKFLYERLKNEMLKMAEDIEQYYWDNVQTPEEFQRKMMLATRICKVLRSTSGEVKGWESGTMTVSGSSVTGIASRNSDVDLCFWISSAHIHFKDNKVCGTTLLKIVEIRLQNDPEFAPTIVSLELVAASIPILKMKVRDVGSNEIVEADMSICTSPDGFVSGAHNSFLIRHYVRFDERVGPLCFFIKMWAEKRRIRAPTEGRFNSYCIVLLVIHYLQCGVFPAVIPNLTRISPGFFAHGEEKGMFNPVLDFGADLPQPVEPIPADCPSTGGRNNLNVAQLFVGFLAYYKEFDFENFYIDMKSSICKRRSNKGGRVIDLIDPIDQHNPARTVQWDSMDHIKDQFKETFQLFVDAFENPAMFPSISDIYVD